jgi:hypothetical protein
MHFSKSGAFVGGITFAVVVGGGTAVATNGGALLIGKSNSATATTGVTNSKGTPLSLVAKKGTPPLAVNNTVKVKNLDSDLLDGKDSTSFLSRSGKAANSDLLDGHDSSAFLGRTDVAADAAELGGKSANTYLETDATAANAAKLGGQPATDFSRTYVAESFVDNDPVRLLLHGGVAPDSVDVPPGTYLVSLTADLANTDSNPGEFSCQIQWVIGGFAAPGLTGHVSLNPVAVGETETYGSASVNQVLTLPTGAKVQALCTVNRGDTHNTSYVYTSTLTATRIETLLGTVTTHP